MATGNDHLPPAPDFGSLLRQLRRRADLTQEELAERAGLRARLISDLERGVIGRPRRDTVRMLATAFDLTPDLSSEFAGIARGPRPESIAVQSSTSLPAPANRLIGREREFATALGLLGLPETRLLTIVGPGGVGKTRLALEIAARGTTRFDGGVTLVDLTTVREPRAVLDLVARTVGVTTSGSSAELDELVVGLRGRRMLIMLDNVEHVIRAAPAIGELSGRCPELTILATSRVPLRIGAEVTLDLEPLALPDPKRDRRADQIEENPAVSLLVELAQAGRPAFAVTDENAATVAEIVHRLDGLPLAIELAAPRLRLMSSASLLTRLQERLPLLTGIRRDAPARQRSLRDTIAWSVDLLTEPEREVFVRLAVFSGTWTYEAVERVAGDIVVGPVLIDAMSSLLDHHLVREAPATGEQPRLTMLETIREYAVEQLERTGRVNDGRGRHADWCLDLIEPMEPELWTGRGPSITPIFEAELGNLRAVYAWASETGDGERAMRVANATCRFLHDTGRARKSRDWLERALVLRPAPMDRLRSTCLSLAGNMEFVLGDFQASERRQQEALAFHESVDDRWSIAGSWCDLGLAADGAGELKLAAERYERSLEMWREQGVRSRVGWLQTNLGMVRMLMGQLDQALESFHEALDIARLEEDRRSESMALSTIGACRLATGEVREAGRVQSKALAMRIELGQPVAMERSIRELGFVAAASDRFDIAAMLLGNAEALRLEYGTPIVGSDEGDYRRWVEIVESGLERHQLERWWASGEHMQIEEACELALSLADELTLAAAAATPLPDSLSDGRDADALSVG